MNNKLRSALVTLAVTAVISSGIVTSAAATHVAGPAPSGSVVHVLKNSNCGWGITTKYHSCDLAYSLVMRWVSEDDYPSSMSGVFSPNSGKRYDVTCSGMKTVTCKSNKGWVKFKPAKVPQQYRCVASEYDSEDVWGHAWLNSSCALATVVTEAYTETVISPPAPSTVIVPDPANGRLIEFACFDVEEGFWPTLCLAANKKAVVIDN